MVGFDSGNALFDVAEETGGSANATLPTHTHTATSTVTDAGHFHNVGADVNQAANGAGRNGVSGNPATGPQPTSTVTTGITVATTNSTEGASATNANYQPYITVYMWKRTA